MRLVIIADGWGAHATLVLMLVLVCLRQHRVGS